MKKFIIILLLLLAFSFPNGDLATTTPAYPPLEQQSAYIPHNPVIIDDVPAFLWYRGCTPTAAAMVLAWWDIQGYDVLPTVDYAMFQDSVMNDAIASPEHWSDYSLPIDWVGELRLDLSEPPAGDEHYDNSIADCLGTSRSVTYLRYGWTWTQNIAPCLMQYSTTDTLTGYVTYCLDDCWNVLVAEIDAGRPVVMTIRDPRGWHSVVGIGYDGGYYATRNTWNSGIVWYPYSDCGSEDWCIREVFTLRVESSWEVEPVEPVKIFLPLILDVYSHHP